MGKVQKASNINCNIGLPSSKPFTNLSRSEVKCLVCSFINLYISDIEMSMVT
jgi:hypothetical protein